MGRDHRRHTCSRPPAEAWHAFCVTGYVFRLVTVALLLIGSTSLTQAGTQRSSRPEYDGRKLVLKLDSCVNVPDKSESADRIAKQLPSALPDLEDCTTLPVQCWLVCQVKASAVRGAQAAVTTDAAAEQENLQLSKVASTLLELSAYSAFEGLGSLVSAASIDVPLQPAAATAASSGGKQRRLFEHVGRSRLLYTAARQLHQHPQSAPVFPSECNDSGCPALWGMNKIRAPAAWTLLADAAQLPLHITKPIMVIDTGVDVLNNNIKTQVNQKASRTFAAAHARSEASNNGKAGLSSHGSHTFCTIAGAWNQGTVDPSNIAGLMGPANGKIVSCNVFGHNGDEDGATVTDLVRCINYAVRAKSHWVINMSLGGYWSRTLSVVALLRDAIRDVCAAGGIVVVAAQNDGRNVDNPRNSYASFPAAFVRELPCVIAVGAIENTNGVAQLADFSNWGADVRIVAPGVAVSSCTNSGGGVDPWAAGYMSGTSMASPHVAGAAAVLVNAFPEATNMQVVNCLLNTATETVDYARFADVPGVHVNGGVLNVAAAYNCVAQLARSRDKPRLSSCSKDTLQDCEVAGLCTAAQGCHCTNGGSCTCNAALGFIPHTSATTGTSRCRWNITMQGNRVLEVPVNGLVKLPVQLPTGFCPAKGVRVVKSVKIEERVSCPATVHRRLSDVTRAAGGSNLQLGETCGRWVLKTDKAGAKAGVCYVARLYTTDNRSYRHVFKYY